MCLWDILDLENKRFFIAPDKILKETNLDENLIKSMCVSCMPAANIDGKGNKTINIGLNFH